MTVVVGTTLTTFAMDDPETWGSWLLHAEAMRDSTPERVVFFVAIEQDGRGKGFFDPLLERLVELEGDDGSGADWWWFDLDDGRTEVTTRNRLRHITAGQNLVVDYCCSDQGVTHLLFLAADLEPPADAIPKLLEMDYPIVGGEVPTYCLHGEKVPGYDFPVEQHMATAAFVMLARPLFRKLRWRWDVDAGMTDDPCLHADAMELGWATLVRKDCVGRHHPETIGAVETRGHDMTVVR